MTKHKYYFLGAWVVIIAVCLLSGCRNDINYYLDYYKKRGYKVEHECRAMPYDIYNSYSLNNAKTGKNIILSREGESGKINVVTLPTDKEFRDFAEWNKTVGNIHNLSFEEREKASD